MAQLVLTVTAQGGNAYAASVIFDSSRMIAPKAVSGGTSFLYPSGTGNYPQADGYTEYVVSESFATVVSMVGAETNSAQPVRQVKLKFDATGGKAVGTYTLVDADTGAAVTLPVGAIITRSFYEVQTTFTTAGSDAGTIALGITGSANAIKAAVAVSDGADPYDAGYVEGIQVGTAATFAAKNASTAKSFIATVATQALTAGKLVLVVEYVVTPTL
jgi:hypothetical protein